MSCIIKTLTDHEESSEWIQSRAQSFYGVGYDAWIDVEIHWDGHEAVVCEGLVRKPLLDQGKFQVQNGHLCMMKSSIVMESVFCTGILY